MFDTLLQMLLDQSGPAIIIATIPVIIAAIKNWIFSLPKWVIPIIAAALGPVMDQAIAYVSSIEATGIAAAMFGLAAVGLRELYKQLKGIFTLTSGL